MVSIFLLSLLARWPNVMSIFLHLVGSITNDMCVYIYIYIYLYICIQWLSYISPDNWSQRYLLPFTMQRFFTKMFSQRLRGCLYPINNHWQGKYLKVGDVPSFGGGELRSLRSLLSLLMCENQILRSYYLGSSFIFIRGQQYPQRPRDIHLFSFHVPQHVFCRRRWYGKMMSLLANPHFWLNSN